MKSAEAWTLIAVAFVLMPAIAVVIRWIFDGLASLHTKIQKGEDDENPTDP